MKAIVKLLILLAVIFVPLGCGKTGKVKILKKPNRISKSKVNKIGKAMTGAVVATGAYLVTREVLSQSFENAIENEPIQAEFKNSATMPASLEFTRDGKNWYSATIDPHEVFSFDSSKKGLIGVKCNDQYLKIDQSNFFTINNKGGTINIYGH